MYDQVEDTVDFFGYMIDMDMGMPGQEERAIPQCKEAAYAVLLFGVTAAFDKKGCEPLLDSYYEIVERIAAYRSDVGWTGYADFIQQELDPLAKARAVRLRHYFELLKDEAMPEKDRIAAVRMLGRMAAVEYLGDIQKLLAACLRAKQYDEFSMWVAKTFFDICEELDLTREDHRKLYFPAARFLKRVRDHLVVVFGGDLELARQILVTNGKVEEKQKVGDRSLERSKRGRWNEIEYLLGSSSKAISKAHSVHAQRMFWGKIAQSLAKVGSFERAFYIIENYIPDDSVDAHEPLRELANSIVLADISTKAKYNLLIRVFQSAQKKCNATIRYIVMADLGKALSRGNMTSEKALSILESMLHYQDNHMDSQNVLPEARTVFISGVRRAMIDLGFFERAVVLTDYKPGNKQLCDEAIKSAQAGDFEKANFLSGSINDKTYRIRTLLGIDILECQVGASTPDKIRTLIEEAFILIEEMVEKEGQLEKATNIYLRKDMIKDIDFTLVEISVAMVYAGLIEESLEIVRKNIRNFSCQIDGFVRTAIAMYQVGVAREDVSAVFEESHAVVASISEPEISTMESPWSVKIVALGKIAVAMQQTLEMEEKVQSLFEEAISIVKGHQCRKGKDVGDMIPHVHKLIKSMTNAGYLDLAMETLKIKVPAWFSSWSPVNHECVSTVVKALIENGRFADAISLIEDEYPSGIQDNHERGRYKWYLQVAFLMHKNGGSREAISRIFDRAIRSGNIYSSFGDNRREKKECENHGKADQLSDVAQTLVDCGYINWALRIIRSLGGKASETGSLLGRRFVDKFSNLYLHVLAPPIYKATNLQWAGSSLRENFIALLHTRIYTILGMESEIPDTKQLEAHSPGMPALEKHK